MRGVGIVHRKKNGSSGVIYRLNCPLGLGGSAGAICYFLLPADFSLKSLTWLKSIYGSSLHLMAFYSAILKNRLFSVCGSWIVFVLLFFIIIQQKNGEKKIVFGAKRSTGFGFHLEIEYEASLLFVFYFYFLFCRSWGWSRSGAAWRPWSRSCCAAAACSSTARSSACSSWPRPSGRTPAPRGQPSFQK